MVLAIGIAVASPAIADEASWIEKSNEHARVVLDVFAEFSPEGAGTLGVDGLDEQILDLGPGIHERNLAASEEVLAEMQRRLEKESDMRVRQDIEILSKALRDNIRTSKLNHDQLLPYYNISQTVFFGIRGLIDPQIPRERYPAAVTRIEKYAGLGEGHTPLVELAKDRTRERFDADGLVGPYRGEVEQDLERAETFVTGIEELLSGTDLEGWQESYSVLAGQLRDYNEWLRAEILPRARDDFRLPAALYEDALRNWGVDASPLDLIEQATKGYMDIRNEMDSLAPLIAAEKGYDTNDYRDVIALLKRDGGIDGDKLVDHYHTVLRDIEEIIVREKIVTLPAREAGIRIASAAETAAQPAPHLDVPRLIGNTGEYPSFVIPLLEQYEDGSWQQTDDTYEAGAWTLTAHEARPGHEMQFSSIIESGVSTARAIFAFNSANVEGWGLYAEAIVRPFLPLEGQLISLQYRLMRAARMFLDPMLNLGLITPEEAKSLIMNDVGIGETWAQNEVERYTYRMPGQATAYYYGYNKMQALRAQTELKLRSQFDQQAYHDFILAQGMLPPDILKDAVMTEFVPSQLN
ncbi:MAG: DUF885 domain-containing protein [Gammaproteobacteria bacterium]|nr:DUF885 domain-containing protein [Gammaproteobacteria bacterium]